MLVEEKIFIIACINVRFYKRYPTHEEAAERLEKRYLDIARQSKKLRKEFNDMVKIWRDDMDDIMDVLSGNLIDLLGAILDIGRQEECA